MKFSILFSIIILIFSNQCFSQGEDWTISGEVKGENGSPIEFATVYAISIKDSIDSPILDLCTTDELGAYVLSIDSLEKQVDIVFNYIGYESKTIKVSSIKQNYLSVQLKIQDYELSEIVVSEDKLPITSRGDTLSYDVNQFRDSTENKVVDLLKKLPGVEVDHQGQISIDGKPIQKVLIEGSDLFGRKYTIGTENLPADYIETIEVIKNYQENVLLKDITASEDIVLNLKLNENAKNQLRGSASIQGGIGDELKTSLDATLFSISRANKNILISNNGNVGTHYGINEIDATYSFSNYDPLTSQILPRYNFVSKFSPNYLNAFRPYIDNSINTFNTMRSYFDLKDKMKLSINGFYSTFNDQQNSATIEESFLEQASYLNNVKQSLSAKNSFANIDFKLNYLDLPKKQSFDFYAQYDRNNHLGRLKNNDVPSLEPSRDSLEIFNQEILLSFLYTKKINTRNVFRAAAKYSSEFSKEDFKTGNINFLSLLNFNDNEGSVFQQINLNRQLTKFSLNFDHKSNGIIISAKSVLLNYHLDINRLFSSENEDGVLDIFEEDIELKIKENYSWENSLFLQKKFQHNISIVANLSSFQALSTQEKIQTNFAFHNNFSYGIDVRKKHNRYITYSLLYQYENRIPVNQFALEYLSSSFDISESIVKNNIENGHSIRFTLSNNKLYKLTSSFVGIRINLAQKKWVQNYTFNNSVRVSIPFFTEMNNEVNFYGKWEKFFPSLKSNVELLPNVSFNRSQLVNQGVVSNVENFSTKMIYRLSLNASKKVKINLNGFIERNLFRQRNMGAGFTNIKAEPSITFSLRDVKANIGINYFNSLSQFSISSYWGSQFRLEKKQQLKNSAVQFSLTLNNFLNVKSYNDIIRNEFFLFQNTVEAINPFLLLGFSFDI